MSASALFDRAVRVILPPVCLICGRRGREWVDCCAGCEADLATVEPRCRQCGLAVPVATDHCGRCIRRPPAFAATWPCYAYERVIETLVHRFKFRRDLAAGRVLAALAARRLAAMRAERPQALVPVPLHWRRQVWRGFNQSAMLARDLGAHLGGIPVAGLLVRQRPTPAQSALPAAGRSGNVRGAFRARPVTATRVRHVAVVDDVMTTGATLDACARALKHAGVERVDVWVVARA